MYVMEVLSEKLVFVIIGMCKIILSSFNRFDNSQTLPGIPWHKFYSLTFPGFPDFGQSWRQKLIFEDLASRIIHSS